MTFRPFLVIISTLVFLVLFLPSPEGTANAHTGFHSLDERAFFSAALNDTTLFEGYNGLFAASGSCVQCHGFDTAGLASVDFLGNDLNVVDDWRSTMMANSAKDPFWRAKVSHEVLLYPQHQEEIETKCTACHAPLGHFAAIHNGASSYTIADMEQDSFGLDGVSCLSCHQQSPELNNGQNHSGELFFDTAKVAYGPYQSPLASPMANATGYQPVFSEHVGESENCAGCHSLLTKTLDYEGNFTGTQLVEQATYHEWLNSDYPAEDVSCQSCHFPAISKGEINIIAGFDTPGRSPFYLHEMAGANTLMLGLFRDNIEALGLSATAEQFEATLAATTDMLQNKSIQLELTALDRTADTAFIALDIRNLAGHKFPSGYPARRAFVELLLTTEQGDTLFHSGAFDTDFDLPAQDIDYESHHQIITSEDQVQIYETVIADVNGDVTTVLERGSYALKDNRLPPRGFSTMHSTYDTVQIVGEASTDIDFNLLDGLEGSGADRLYFHIPVTGQYAPLQARARVYYQAAPPRWMAEMFAESTPEIEIFRSMFDAADRSPVLIKEATTAFDLFVSNHNIVHTPFVTITQNLLFEPKVDVQSSDLHNVLIYNVKGQFLRKLERQSGSYSIELPDAAGLYILQFQQEGRVQTEKIILY